MYQSGHKILRRRLPPSPPDLGGQSDSNTDGAPQPSPESVLESRPGQKKQPTARGTESREEDFLSFCLAEENVPLKNGNGGCGAESLAHEGGAESFWSKSDLCSFWSSEVSDPQPKDVEVDDLFLDEIPDEGHVSMDDSTFMTVEDFQLESEDGEENLEALSSSSSTCSCTRLSRRSSLADDDEVTTCESPEGHNRVFWGGFHPDQTLIIFDWDDTILPTSWLRELLYVSPNGVSTVSSFTDIKTPHQMELEALANQAVITLSEARSLGSVMIITNGSEDWIQTTCGIFLPPMVGMVKKVRQVSAKHLYQHLGEGSPDRWKTAAFSKEIEGHFANRRIEATVVPNECTKADPDEKVGPSEKSVGSKAAHEEDDISLTGLTGGDSYDSRSSLTSSDETRWKNVVSIGDSTYERMALLNLAKTMPRDFFKSCMLLRTPTISELRSEHEQIRCFLRLLVHHAEHVTDLCISRR